MPDLGTVVKYRYARVSGGEVIEVPAIVAKSHATTPDLIAFILEPGAVPEKIATKHDRVALYAKAVPTGSSSDPHTWGALA